MSEPSKCPCCGVIVMVLAKGTIECFKCPFVCAVKDYPRISSAMELATRLAKMRDLANNKRPCSDSDDYNGRVIAMSEALEDYQSAKDRVLEVFSG